jgi:hypothetical protein
MSCGASGFFSSLSFQHMLDLTFAVFFMLFRVVDSQSARVFARAALRQINIQVSVVT